MYEQSQLFYQLNFCLNLVSFDHWQLHYDSGDPTLLNVINLTDIAIRRMIKMAKKLAAFKTFCQEDQIALLKGGCTELMILRSVMSYDADKGCWKVCVINRE